MKNLNANSARITSIDLLRGIVMILMALDHTRDYFHYNAFFFEPTDITKTTAPLFFTRFITHYCAPVFMLLAGTSAFFVGRRKNKKELSIWLIKRGLWLIILEFTIIKFAWYFRLDFTFIEAIVIWALGVGMISLATFIHLPKKLVIILCTIGIVCHNLLDNLQVDPVWLSNLLVVFHQIAPLQGTGNIDIWVYYPLIPWIFVMPLGYHMGSLYSSSFKPESRRKTLLQLGVGMTAGFFILRYLNFYGDLNPWSPGETVTQTILSFFNVHKYPPSLLYLLITLGPSLIFLSVAEKWGNAFLNKIVIIGRVPMFYYILHLFAIHLAACVAAYACGYGASAMILDGWVTSQPHLVGYGFSLPIVYLIWLGILVILYPISRWYENYKKNNRDKWWLSYL